MYLVTSHGEKSKAAQSAHAGRSMHDDGAWHWLTALSGRLFGGLRIGSGRTGAPRMQILEMLPLGARKQLVLVRCDGETYLIGTGPESVQSIQRIEARVSGPGVTAPELGERS